MPRKDPACFLNRVRKKMAVPFPLLCSFPQPGVPGNGWLSQAPQQCSDPPHPCLGPSGLKLTPAFLKCTVSTKLSNMTGISKVCWFFTKDSTKMADYCPQPVPPHPLTQNWRQLSSSAFTLHDPHNVNKACKYDLNVKTMSMVHKQIKIVDPDSAIHSWGKC